MVAVSLRTSWRRCGSRAALFLPLPAGLAPHVPEDGLSRRRGVGHLVGGAGVDAALVAGAGVSFSVIPDGTKASNKFMPGSFSGPSVWHDVRMLKFFVSDAEGPAHARQQKMRIPKRSFTDLRCTA